jgi:hypothetical protein
MPSLLNKIEVIAELFSFGEQVAESIDADVLHGIRYRATSIDGSCSRTNVRLHRGIAWGCLGVAKAADLSLRPSGAS